MSVEALDRRIRKTRKQLKECLITLLKEKRVQDITVRELTEMADLNRGTFYLHYKDVFDLLEKAETELLDEFNDLIRKHGPSELKNGFSGIFYEICRLVSDNAAFVQILLGENGDLNFINRLKELLREKCLQDWLEAFGSGDPAIFDAYFSFFRSGCIGLIQYWLQNGMKETPEQISMLAEQFVTMGIGVLDHNPYA